MSYLKFLLKQTCRNWLNIVPFVLVIAFLVFIYYGSYMVAFRQITDPKQSGEQDLVTLEEDVMQFQEELNRLDESSEEYQYYKKNLEIAKQRFAYTTEKVKAIEEENWEAYYNSEIKLNDLVMNAVKNDQESHGSLLKELPLSKSYMLYMIDHELAFDDRFVPIQGISYLNKVNKDLMPILLSVIGIFMISRLFCVNYQEDMDIQRLLPMSHMNKQGTKLLAGSIIGGGAFLAISFIAILCGTIAYTLGNLELPILSYTMLGSDSFVSFASVLPKFIILSILSICFIVNVVSLISLFTRTQMKCLLCSLVLVVGGLFLITNVVPLFSMAHLFPWTYLHAFKVISGELCYALSNEHVNFLYGMVVLLLSNGFLFFLTYVLSKQHLEEVMRT